VFGWNGFPNSRAEFRRVGSKIGTVSLSTWQRLFFAGSAWALWNNRNKMLIEHTFPDKPMGIVLTGVAFLQKWRPLKKENNCRIWML